MKNTDLIWLAAGAAFGFFLNSEKGKKVRTDAVKYLDDTATTVTDKGSQVVDQAAELMATLRSKGNEYLKALRLEAVGSQDVDAFVETKVGEFKQRLINEVHELQNANSVNNVKKS